MNETNFHKDPGSFRDPSGCLFYRNGELYRQVNRSYKEDYDQLMQSGLYDSLVKEGLLVPHREMGLSMRISDDAYVVIKPEPIPFVSYPYEWCFSQLKAAAELTLTIQQRALQFGMSLKDCSAYNVQFSDWRPIFIDTLSFERSIGRPWIGFRQFCQHFIAPLALARHKDARLTQLLRIYLDGIPVDLASSLLPCRTWLSLSLGFTIHLHARFQKHYGEKVQKDRSMKGRGTDPGATLYILQRAVNKLKWKPGATEWADYYEKTNYGDEAFESKRAIVARFLETARPSKVWDLGANTGVFSRIAGDLGIHTVAFDMDPAAVELNYQECVKKAEKSILPLLLDLTNPSPDLGWANTERKALFRREHPDLVMALALVHHLAIANNVPLNSIADLLRGLCTFLIIEFVPKSDSQVQRMLATREDIFPSYTQEGFETAFSNQFEIMESMPVALSERTIYLMRAR
ncbi:MAG: class I SAM-dependent methyltransferase [Thermodesulfobacteriota bacterium]